MRKIENIFAKRKENCYMATKRICGLLAVLGAAAVLLLAACADPTSDSLSGDGKQGVKAAADGQQELIEYPYTPSTETGIDEVDAAETVTQLPDYENAWGTEKAYTVRCTVTLDSDTYPAGVTKLTGKLTACEKGVALKTDEVYGLYRVHENGEEERVCGLVYEACAIMNPKDSDSYAEITIGYSIKSHNTDGIESLTAGKYRFRHTAPDGSESSFDFTVTENGADS